MIAASLALIFTPCLREGEVSGIKRAWYRTGDAITFDQRKYVKYGLPRTGVVQYVEVVGELEGVPITAEKGQPSRDVIYLLADIGECSLQPYQVEPG